jgi:hypothetical protein
MFQKTRWHIFFLRIRIVTMLSWNAFRTVTHLSLLPITWGDSLGNSNYMPTFISQGTGFWESEDRQTRNNNAAPNGTPAMPVGDLEVAEGPPSASRIVNPH